MDALDIGPERDLGLECRHMVEKRGTQEDNAKVMAGQAQ